MDAVGLTSLWVAAMRAVESEREDCLFKDPFARDLAGERGFEVLRAMDPGGGPPRPPTIVVRTRFLDDNIARVLAGGVRQVVILAAGMDSRAYRLDWPVGTVVYEIDQPAVLAHKHDKLSGVAPRCERRAVAIDLAEDWPSALTAQGFERGARTLWLVEGLLPYLRDEHVPALFARIDALSTAGSSALFDCIGRSVIESPYMTWMLAAVAKLGAPWQYGNDQPEEFLAPLGWDVCVHDIAAVGGSHGRWPYPAMPRGTPGVPQTFLVEATKR
jgi:methyltransferase (TIGR00027 family)